METTVSVLSPIFGSSLDGQTDNDEYEPPVQFAQVGSKMHFSNVGHKPTADFIWPTFYFGIPTHTISR